ncbi:MAG: LPS assembly lipoprotein LptE [Paracoccaceae bacterium]|jgi:LPS-assembly lipoprotein
MSLFNRRSLFLLPLALAACGFTPVHAPGGNGASLYGQINVQEPTTAYGYHLTRDLEERLGRTSSGTYDLTYVVRTNEQGQAVTPSGDTTRYSIVGEADFTLTRIADQTVIAKGKTGNFTGYSAEGSTVDVLAGERAARERLMLILADQIATQIYATADTAAGTGI